MFSCSRQSQNQKITICISAPGKVILHGEHSVVYDKLAVAASLGLRTKLQFHENDGPKVVTLDLPALNLRHIYNLEDILDFINEPFSSSQKLSYNFTNPELLDHSRLVQAAEKFAQTERYTDPLTPQQNVGLIALFFLFRGILSSVEAPLEPFTLRIETELTIGAGTGSSASYCVTIAAFLLQLIRLKNFKTKTGHKSVKVDILNLKYFDKSELELISKWGFAAERIIHGTPSGIDNTICTYGSMVEFRKGSAPKLVKLSKKLNYILINTQVPRDTKVLVKGVATLREKHPSVIEAILDAMERTSTSALHYIRKIDETVGDSDVTEYYDRLAELSDLNQNLLRSLGVSHPTLDEVCSLVADRGLHGKLTGAGGGGYAICLVPPYISHSKIEDVITVANSKGFHAIFTDLGGKGVTIDETSP